MSEKLQIYIISDYRVGAADGLAEFNYQNVNLLRNDFTFHFVEFDNHQPASFQENNITDGFKIFRFGIKGLSVFKLPDSFLTWLGLIQKNNSILHLHHIYNLRNYFISRQLVQLGLPYLITPHDSFVYSPEYRKKRPLLKRLYRDAFVSLFDKYVLDHAKVVHALTEQCLECLQHITTSPIVVVLNQVNDMQIGFNPVSLKQQICFIGRFDILRKGIDLALQSYKLYLKKRVDESAVSFTLIGPAKQQAEEESLRICEELNLEVGKDVVFTGKIALEDRNKILSESRVYMQLSRSEGFGLSIAQALCCYKPVIVSKQVPIHDKIIAYKGGFAVGNPEEASQALNTVFSLSDEDYKTMSMNARLCYEQEFHPSIIRPKLIQLYNAALEPSILSNR